MSPSQVVSAVRVTLATGLVLGSTTALSANSPGHQRAAAAQIIDVCQMWSLPTSAVGKQIALRARVHQDIESSYIYGDCCPDTVVGLSYTRSSPSLVGCLVGTDKAHCGLSKNDQLAIVIGTLVRKGKVRRSSQGLPLRAGQIEVIEFRAAPPHACASAEEAPETATTRLSPVQVSTVAAAALKESGASVSHYDAGKPRFYAKPDFYAGSNIWLVFYRQNAAPYVADGDMVVVVNDRTGKACVQQMTAPPLPCN